MELLVGVLVNILSAFLMVLIVVVLLIFLVLCFFGRCPLVASEVS